MTESIKPNLACFDFAQLEMNSDVAEMQPGERFTWRSSGKQRFIHRTYPNLEMDDDGNIIRSVGGGSAGYEDVVPGFEMSPRGIAFHQQKDYVFCFLESVVHDGVEQLAASPYSNLEIFALSAYTHSEPLAVAWPTFDEGQPLSLTFRNPMERVLPSFSLSLFLDVPKDFASRWRKV